MMGLTIESAELRLNIRNKLKIIFSLNIGGISIILKMYKFFRCIHK